MKEQALWLYQRLTAHSRRRLLATLRQDGKVPIAILFYHRIANVRPNLWTISREDFAEQIDWLQNNYDIVSLEEAQRRIRAPFCDRPTVSITFDDGYAENAEFAIPELVRRGLPATYFVSTKFVESRLHFPHDVRAGDPLEPNTIEEIREFSQCGIEIGTHTRSHVDMGQVLDKSSIQAEIVGSAAQIERWISKPVRYFAFPYGLPNNTSQEAVDVLVESGFEGFCTAYGAWNWPGSHGFHLRRIHADPGLEKLKNWLTYDSRKLRERQSLPFVERTSQVQSENFASSEIVEL